MKIERVGEESFPRLSGLFFDGGDAASRDLIRLAAVEDGDAVGGLSFSVQGDRCLLESLYVVRRKRGKGVAGVLLKAAEELAATLQCEELEAVFNDSAEGMNELFQKLGYHFAKGSTIYVLKAEDFLEMPVFRQLSVIKNQEVLVKRYSALLAGERHGVSEMLKEAGIAMNEEVLADFAPDLSSVVLDPSHRILALVLVSHIGSDAMIDLIYSPLPDPATYVLRAMGRTRDSLWELQKSALKKVILHGGSAGEIIESFFMMKRPVLEELGTATVSKQL